ncbi:Serine protease inhibitor Kazal-type 9 [Manis javanica]|nr:Serine protease inhibitor Kazal-type 9 [Manis javanica]
MLSESVLSRSLYHRLPQHGRCHHTPTLAESFLCAGLEDSVSGDSYFTTDAKTLDNIKQGPTGSGRHQKVSAQPPSIALGHLGSMKAALVLLFALALTTVFDVECARRQQVDCSQYKKLPPGEETFCYDIYAPICGSDGKTYSNDCYFCCEVKKTDDKLKFVHFGKC